MDRVIKQKRRCRVAVSKAGSRLGRSLALGLCLMLCGVYQPVSAQNNSLPEIKPVRELYGEEYLEACEARNKADRLQAAFIDRYRWSSAKKTPPKYPSPDAEVARNDYDEVVAAYRMVSARYPNTQIAAYSLRRLSDFHRYRRETPLAIRVERESAETGAGIYDESQAYYAAGMIEIQGKRPEAAVEWFKKISRPGERKEESSGSGEGGRADVQLYISAQKEIVAAESAMGRTALAQARAQCLGERYSACAEYAKKRLGESEATTRPSDWSAQLQQAREQIDREEGAAAAGIVKAQKYDAALALRLEIRTALGGAVKEGKVNAGIIGQLNELEGKGVDVPEFLKDEYRRSEGAVLVTYVILDAIESRGTPQAKAVLRELALKPGIHGVALGPRAVESYGRLSKDSGEIVQLLASPQPETKEAVARAIRGLALDASVVKAMETLIGESKSIDAYVYIAEAFGQDPRPDTADKKVEILLDASMNLSQLKEAEEDIRGRGYTGREYVLMSYARALGKMQNPQAALKRHLDDKRELPRQLAVIGLALQGNKEVHDDVVGIIRKSEDGCLRLLAVEALLKVGTKQDQVLLAELAKNDPYRRPSLSCVGPRGEWYYPVRSMAGAVMEKLEKQKK